MTIEERIEVLFKFHEAHEANLNRLFEMQMRNEDQLARTIEQLAMFQEQYAGYQAQQAKYQEQQAKYQEQQARYQEQQAKQQEQQARYQAKNEVILAKLLDGMMQHKDSIVGLARIAEAHEHRISNLEEGRQ